MRDAELVELMRPQRADGKTGKFGCTLRSRTMWLRLRTQGHDVARCTVERLMRQQGREGARYGSQHRTTVADESHPRFRTCALRGVGARWTRVLWRCWQDGTTYDPALHLKHRPTAVTA